MLQQLGQLVFHCATAFAAIASGMFCVSHLAIWWHWLKRGAPSPWRRHLGLLSLWYREETHQARGEVGWPFPMHIASLALFAISLMTYALSAVLTALHSLQG